MNKIPTLSTTTHYFVDILPKNGDQSHEISLAILMIVVIVVLVFSVVRSGVFVDIILFESDAEGDVPVSSVVILELELLIKGMFDEFSSMGNGGVAFDLVVDGDGMMSSFLLSISTHSPFLYTTLLCRQ